MDEYIKPIIVGLIVAFVAKISLEQWKRITVNLLPLFGIAVVVAIVVFVVSTASDQIINRPYKPDNPQVATANKLVQGFAKLYFPDEFKEGYTVGVHEINPEIIVGFDYPENKGYPDSHPMDYSPFKMQINDMLREKNFKNPIRWYYRARIYTKEEYLEKVRQKNANK